MRRRTKTTSTSASSISRKSPSFSFLLTIGEKKVLIELGFAFFLYLLTRIAFILSSSSRILMIMWKTNNDPFLNFLISVLVPRRPSTLSRSRRRRSNGSLFVLRLDRPSSDARPSLELPVRPSRTEQRSVLSGSSLL